MCKLLIGSAILKQQYNLKWWYAKNCTHYLGTEYLLTNYEKCIASNIVSFCGCVWPENMVFFALFKALFPSWGKNNHDDDNGDNDDGNKDNNDIGFL